MTSTNSLAPTLLCDYGFARAPNPNLDNRRPENCWSDRCSKFRGHKSRCAHTKGVTTSLPVPVLVMEGPAGQSWTNTTIHGTKS